MHGGLALTCCDLGRNWPPRRISLTPPDEAHLADSKAIDDPHKWTAPIGVCDR
jgi:hypothetical protein